MNLNSDWGTEWIKCGCKSFRIDEEIRVFEGGLGGHLDDLLNPEKKNQFGLSDDADPDGDCYDFILNEAETTKQVDGFLLRKSGIVFTLIGDHLKVIIA